MVLRMVRIQVPMVVISSAAAGSSACGEHVPEDRTGDRAGVSDETL